VTRTGRPKLPRAAAIAALTVCAALLAGAARTSLAAQELLPLARAAAERGRIDSAYALLLRAVDAEPNRAEAQFWLGQVAGTLAAERRNLSSFGLARRAKRAFGRAVQLEPRNPLYLEGLGRYLSAAPGIVGGDRDSARSLGEVLLGVDSMRGTFLLVGLLRRGNDRDKARADSLVEAFSAHPTGGREGLVRLGLYFSRGRPERALPVGERLVAEDASDPLGRLVLGGALVALKREPEAAARHLRWAIDHPPPVTTDGRQYWPPSLWFRLGQAYIQMDRPDSARAAMQEALRLEPGFRPAKQALDSLARRR
jgi:tetratricopeptide (TPR) repeat protein